MTGGGSERANPQRNIWLEVKKTRLGKLLTFADSAAPSGLRGMTDSEIKAHDHIENVTARFDTDRVSPGVVGYAELDGDNIVISWCSDEACAAAGGGD